MADYAVGVLVGVALGLGILVYFVFVHSEGTIDAPKINGTGSGGQEAGNPVAPVHPDSAAEPAGGGRAKSEPKRELPSVPVVRVIGGAPPTGSGPKTLEFRKGETVRFKIDIDEPFSFEIRGLNIKESLEQSATITFRATKSGQFPVIASSTLIGVADLLIKK